MTNSTSSATASVSVPFLGLAFAVLLVLKVAGMAGASWGLANLSWWWVFSPVLIGIGLTLAVLVLFGLGFLVYLVVDTVNRKRRVKRAARARAARQEAQRGRRN